MQPVQVGAVVGARAGPAGVRVLDQLECSLLQRGARRRLQVGGLQLPLHAWTVTPRLGGCGYELQLGPNADACTLLVGQKNPSNTDGCCLHTSLRNQLGMLQPCMPGMLCAVIAEHQSTRMCIALHGITLCQ